MALFIRSRTIKVLKNLDYLTYHKLYNNRPCFTYYRVTSYIGNVVICKTASDSSGDKPTAGDKPTPTDIQAIATQISAPSNQNGSNPQSLTFLKAEQLYNPDNSVLAKTVPQDLQRGFDLLEKKLSLEPLAIAEIEELKKFTPETIMQILTDYEHLFKPADPKLFTKFDVLQITLILLHKGSEGFVKLNFSVLKDGAWVSHNEICDFFKDLLWDQTLGHLVSSDVQLSAIQVKIIAPSYRTNDVYTKSYLIWGLLTTDFTETSSQHYGIRMGSKLVSGNRTDHTLRLPFLVTEVVTKNSYGEAKYMIALTNLKTILTQQIVVVRTVKEGVEQVMVVKKVLNTSRRNAPSSFLPVDNIAYLGFLVQKKTKITQSELFKNTNENTTDNEGP